MTKGSSTGPKASVQYVRTVRKSLDRLWEKTRGLSADVTAIYEMVSDLMSMADPEIVDTLPTHKQRKLFAEEE